MRFEIRRLYGDDAVIGGVAVMNENVVGDEVVCIFDFKIVGLFFADVFDESDTIPVQITFGIAFDMGSSK
jgi:hypothetical protein